MSILTDIGTKVGTELKSTNDRITTLENTAGSTNGTITAWANINGNTVTIRNNLNIGSVTRLGTGYYRVYFTTAMTNNTYSVVGTTSYNDIQNDGNRAEIIGVGKLTTTYFDVETYNIQNTSYNVQNIYLQITGGK